MTNNNVHVQNTHLKQGVKSGAPEGYLILFSYTVNWYNDFDIFLIKIQ